MHSPPDAAAPTPGVDELYHQNHRWLLDWLQRRLGCADTAADLAHDTFLRLLDGRRLVRLQQPRAYLARIAHGLVVDGFRRADLERAYRDALAAQPLAEHPSAEAQAIVLETLREVDRLLSTLSARARQAFLLHRLDGLSQVDIARQLGVSAPRVHQYLTQATRACYIARYGQPV